MRQAEVQADTLNKLGERRGWQRKTARSIGWLGGLIAGCRLKQSLHGWQR